MTKRLLLLSGLAILAVVANHTTGWGFTAMFWWVDRYSSVDVPNFDQVGSFTYYVLLVIQQLAVFSVPSFLFVTGFFVAYADRGGRSTLNWKTMITRIKNLLIPYFIWSTMIFVVDALQGFIYAPVEYLGKLVSGGATVAYFYVPLLCQFYLLSPLITPHAKNRWKLVLVVAALLQLGTLSLRYLVGYRGKTPTLTLMMHMTPEWLFPGWGFFFAFGLVSGFHLTQFKQLLSRFRWGLLIVLLLSGFLAVLEPQAPLHTNGVEWGRSLVSVSSHLYAVSFILCFLAFQEVGVPGSKTIYALSKASFGIYLLHLKVLEFVARGIRQIVPWILAHQIIFQPLLVAMGVGIPLWLMTVVSKSPVRKYFRYLFG